MSEEMNQVEISTEETIPEEPVSANPKGNTQPPTGNFVLALLAAFIGAILGSFVWIAVFKIGLIAGFAGAAIVLCSLKGYQLLRKGMDKAGVVCCITLSVIMIFLANRIAWAWELMDFYISEGTQVKFWDIFPLTEFFLSKDGLGYYFRDLLVGYALTVIATYRTVINAFKTAKS